MTIINNTTPAANINGAVNVKLEFYGELRRFPTQGGSYQSLMDDVRAVLNLDKARELVLRYRDEEGDLIVMSSDMELRSAIQAGRLLRLYASYKEGVPQSSSAVATDKGIPDATIIPQVEQGPPAFVPPGPVFGPPGFAPASFPPVPVPGSFGHPHPHPHPPPHSHFHPNGPFHHQDGAEGGFGGHYGGNWKHFHRGGYGNPGYGAGRGKWAKHAEKAEKYAWMQNMDALADSIAQMGFDVKKEKICRLLKRFDGNADEVARLLAFKREKKQYKESKREARNAAKASRGAERGAEGSSEMDITKS